MFRRVLVPVDLSERSAECVAMAARLVDAQEGTLHLLHVIETIPGLDVEEERDFYDRLERAAAKHLEKLGEPLGEKEVRFNADIVYGSRAAAILAEAERLSADLLVMRSHRVDRSEGFGTLSYQIGILATCPVLLVK